MLPSRFTAITTSLTTSTALALALALTTGSCAADDASGEDGGGRTGKGGPHSLVGFSWESEPFTVNGIELQFALEFEDDRIILSNTCNGELTAQVAAPLRYTYEAEVLEEVSDRNDSGGDYCEVELRRGSFEAEIVEGGLSVTFENESRVFEPAGGVAGIYGDWGYRLDGVGDLVWSMGGGEIFASFECDNGLSASVSAATNFTNYLRVEDSVVNEVENDFGLSCTASIDAATMEYEFDGGDLILSMGGESLRLEKK